MLQITRIIACAPRRFLTSSFVLVGAASITLGPVRAQENEGVVAPVETPSSSINLDFGGANSTVVYEPDFFAVYRPVTALEMVSRVPGFQLDDGDTLRGFGANAGNVLVNGERPSAKTTTLSDFLRRIPAKRVERIEVIRGATGALEARVQGVVVNIVLKQEDKDGPAVSWQAVGDYDGGRLTPRAEIALSDSIGATDFTLAAERFAVFSRERGPEEFLSATSPEIRDETARNPFSFWGGALTTETEFGGGRVLRTNFQFLDEKIESTENSIRTLLTGGDPSIFFQDFNQDEIQIEASVDFETGIAPDLSGKFVAIFNYEYDEGVSRLTITDPAGGVSENAFAFVDDKGEGIARAEFGWTRWEGHRIQFGGEGVWNDLDSEATFTIDGFEIPIDGADTRVTEVRTEAFIIDSWKASSNTTIDIGFALELSTIRQTGDFENRRSFVFPKPTLAITHNLSGRAQLRLRGARDVAQLDFGEFVSATNFDDNDIDFGNPELQPERTWQLEASIEKRFGEFGVVTLTGFHDWIDDVQDLLPLGGIFESPGNIGQGRRWGGEIDLTATLDAVGLANVRIEADARVQGSAVTDPVTGDQRRLSNERPWNYSIDLRQDFKRAGVAWGVGASDRGRDDSFGLDEIVRVDEGVQLTAFVETTRIRGVKAELRFGNLLNRTLTRDRAVFDGPRGVSPVLFEENHDRLAGANVALVLSGAF
ncbi:MAG: TonB-dependent receptor [Pseudomonadota bacterium]